MKNVFLSYARLDRDRAKALYDELSTLPDIDVWFDEVHLIPGTRWKPAIRKTIRESRYFIALLSKKSSSTKGYRHSELRQAIEIMEEFPEDYIFVIPTRLDDCDPPVDSLRELAYADLFPDWNTGVANLRRTLGVRSPKVVPARSGKQVKKKRQAKSPAMTLTDLSSRSRRRKDYHYQVGLVDLDAGLRQLKSVARGLNSVQSFVYFHVSDLKPNRKALQKAEGLPQLDLNSLSKQFYAKISPLQMDHVICLTDRFLMFEEDDDVYYNYLGSSSPVDERVAFSSIRGLDDHAEEAGVPSVVALSHVLVSDITSYFLNLGFHKATRGCPLDFTEDHADKVIGLSKGTFCKSCQRKLDRNQPLKEAMTAMLQWGR